MITLNKTLPAFLLSASLAFSANQALANTGQTDSIKQQTQTELDHYQQEAKKLLTNLENKQGNIEQQARQLVDLSKPIVQRFIQRHAQCGEYLGALQQAADHIAKLPLAEIESGYHADGKLPALTDASCYHAKDLLVHAATVQAMATIGLKDDTNWKSAAHEIEEVLEHFGQVEAAFK